MQRVTMHRPAHGHRARKAVALVYQQGKRRLQLDARNSAQYDCVKIVDARA